MEKKTNTKDMRWHLADILDLEYFIHRDRDYRDALLDKRDRRIFVGHIQPKLRENALNKKKVNSTLLRLWLEERRKIEEKSMGKARMMPGDAFDGTYKFFRFFICIAGIITGSAMAAAVLRYTGIKPINVSYYLGGLVLVQILFLLMLLFLSIFRKLGIVKEPTSPIYRFLADLMTGITAKIKKGVRKKGLGKNEQNIRDSFLSALGVAKARKRVWGNVMYWPLFILAQLFGIGLNIGILVVTLIRVSSTDLAFGWQSTLDVGAQFIYRMTSFIAAPWSWLVSAGTAHPTLAQVEGSRMILKDGIYRLATQDLTAWWPFLCLCVLFYGLLPRLALFVVGILYQKKRLSGLDFSTGDCDRIVTRLITPLVSAGASGVSEPVPPPILTDKIEPETDAVSRSILKHDTQCIALVPEDIFEQATPEELLVRFSNRFSIKGMARFKVFLDTEADEDILAWISGKRKSGGLSNIFLLLEAWQPPIKETLAFIKELRHVLDEHLLIYIGLIGKPTVDTIFTPVEEVDFKIWQRKLTLLNDPYIRLERYKPR